MSETKGEQDGVTLASLAGSVPDLVPNPVSSEAWVRRFRDGYDAGYEAALASRPAVPAEVREATAWLARCVECGWIDIGDMHDAEEWKHVKTLLAHLSERAQ